MISYPSGNYVVLSDKSLATIPNLCLIYRPKAGRSRLVIQIKGWSKASSKICLDDWREIFMKQFVNKYR